MKNFFEMARPTVSFEVVQSGSMNNSEEIYTTVDSLLELKPDMISVTYNGTPQIASEIQGRYDINGLAHITCKGSTKARVKENLERLKDKKVKNILVVRGDRYDKYQGKSEFNHSSELIEFIRQEYADEFDIFAVCYP